MDLQGSIALVTGGTKGIGAATAIALAMRGADVAIVGRHDDEEAWQTQTQIEAAGRRCLVVVADIGKAENCARCVAETEKALGLIDVLVHAAGGAIVGGLLDLAPEAWQEAFDVHVHAVFHLCRAAVPAMKAKRQGAIVLISSVAGIRESPSTWRIRWSKGRCPNSPVRWPGNWRMPNIRVNCIAPGIIRTRSTSK